MVGLFNEGIDGSIGAEHVLCKQPGSLMFDSQYHMAPVHAIDSASSSRPQITGGDHIPPNKQVEWGAKEEKN